MAVGVGTCATTDTTAATLLRVAWLGSERRWKAENGAALAMLNGERGKRGKSGHTARGGEQMAGRRVRSVGRAARAPLRGSAPPQSCGQVPVVRGPSSRRMRSMCSPRAPWILNNSF